MRNVRILVVNSITQPGPEAAGQVVVAASHGGLIAGAIAAAKQVRAVIFNDAGGGRDDAGFASLAPLQQMGLAAVTVARRSARMGDGEHMHRYGVVSQANALAQRCGVKVGMPCAEAAQGLMSASMPRGPAFTWTEGRHILRRQHPLVMGCDSVTLVQPQDAHRILVVGSHAALHAGPASALGVPAAGAFFHDAGSWGETHGLSRLPVLAHSGIPAAAVHHQSARIGDARSMHATGVISFCNTAALELGWRTGMSVQDAIDVVSALAPPEALFA
jgi:hypothetical protein